MRKLFLSALIPIVLLINGCESSKNGCDSSKNENYIPLMSSTGLHPHLTVSSAYWVFGNELNLHGDEVNHYLTEAHGNPNLISNIETTDVKWVLDIESYLFDYKNNDLFVDIDQRIDNLAITIAGKEQNISRFYLADEPYLHAKRIPLSRLETAIKKIKDKFPGIPVSMTFQGDTFLKKKRGIPSNLDIISFDIYSKTTKGNFKKNMEKHVIPIVEKIKKRTKIPILLSAEAYGGNGGVHHSDAELIDSIARYWDYADSEPQIIGIDHFTWADNPDFLGLTSLPKSQALVKALSKEVRVNLKSNEMPTDKKIPVYEYVEHDSKNGRLVYKYHAWFWSGWSKTNYKLKEVKFYLPPNTEPNTANLFMCTIDKKSEANRGYAYYGYQLSLDSTCGNQTLARSSKLIGGIFTSKRLSTIPLYEFSSNGTNSDKAYSTNIKEYQRDSYHISNNGKPIGFVYSVL